MYLLTLALALLQPRCPVRPSGPDGDVASSKGCRSPESPRTLRVVRRRRLGRGFLVLARDRRNMGFLYRVDRSGRARPVACDPLEGAWGLWVADVDRDGRKDAVVALRKRARFDPVLENRLHVYALRGTRCVPMWRGTRLAGRFDGVFAGKSRLLAIERIGKGLRRVALYRWIGFGYAVERVLWKGRGRVPLSYRKQVKK